MHSPDPYIVKGYRHKTMLNTAYLWLPVFAVVIFICSYFEKFRIILFLTVVAATYAFILKQLKNKAVPVYFKNDKIQIDDTEIPLTNVESFYISRPLNELIILRLRTKDQNLAVYLEKDQENSIKAFLNKVKIEEQKTPYDTYLQYGHLILPFIGLIICGVVYKLYYYIQYSFN
ncbi:hypothetical protein GCM10022216_17310 [Sphingobacterium kyonggiense]|uniref:PH (Pleckstrin Homology) domain-containing protein n=2 Tax=Sphingobacterium kyonggiense TaxID=714075 RepID=A0ABP7YRG7_9SPHI